MAGPGLKVMDGLFIGDRDASADRVAAADAKVSHVINCCGQQLFNRWERMGIVYLTYKWMDGGNQIILDEQDTVVNEVFRFIEDGLEGGGSTLIHSFYGQSRSCCILSAYMMKKYLWSMQKTLEFLKYRRLDINMKPTFTEQLLNYERRLALESQQPLSIKWDEQNWNEPNCAEALLRNTFINGQVRNHGEYQTCTHEIGQRTQLLKWSDDMTNDRLRLETCIDDENQCVQSCVTYSGTKFALRSALKGTREQATTNCSDHATRCGDKGTTTITIQTPSGLVECSPDEIVPKRFGLKFHCNTIILEYAVPSHGLRAHHSVCVDMHGTTDNHGSNTFSSTNDSTWDTCDIAMAKRLQHAHAPWLSGISMDQLTNLVGRLRCT